MVQSNASDTPDALAPEAVYERRKNIVEAIRFELELERALLVVMESELQNIEDIPENDLHRDALCGECTEKQFEVGELEDAMQSIINTLDVHQINALKKELDL